MQPVPQGAPSSLFSEFEYLIVSPAQRELREKEARRKVDIEKLDDILSKEHSTFVQVCLIIC